MTSFLTIHAIRVEIPLTGNCIDTILRNAKIIIESDYSEFVNVNNCATVHTFRGGNAKGTEQYNWCS